jgi:predicted transcriptional regulator
MRNHSLKSMEAKIEAEYQLPLADVVRGFIVDDGETVQRTAAILEVKLAALVAYCRIKGIGGHKVRRKIRVVDAARSETRSVTIRQLRREHDPISFARLSDITGLSPDCIRKRFNALGDLRQAVNTNFQPRRPGRPSREK